jgi:hypothetical protein
MEWNQVAENIFYGLSSLTVLWMGYSFADVKQSIKDMAESVTELNIKIAMLLERTDGHEKRISRLEDKDE